MSIKLKVIARTIQEIGGTNSNNSLYGSDDLYSLGGKMAGICYGKEDYFDTNIQREDLALKRAAGCVKSGHHSPFEHGYITLEIRGIPKILAMILNSTESYVTSEKSARYTMMTPNTELEKILYDKWKEIFKDEISKYISSINVSMTEKEIEKLAMENARYMISVFSPTSMAYTASYRQFNYMCFWFDELEERLSKKTNSFNDRLKNAVHEFNTKLKEVIKPCIKDNKDCGFKFMASQYDRDFTTYSKNYYGDVYSIKYLASFACLAQLERHRTIHYEMMFSGIAGEYGAYIPRLIIVNDNLRKMWLEDFELVKGEFPQCTYAQVLEQGRTEDFLNKCKERLCSRAQLEICNITENTMATMLGNSENMSYDVKQILEECSRNGDVIPRCMFKRFKCSEKCTLGAKHLLDRKI